MTESSDKTNRESKKVAEFADRSSSQDERNQKPGKECEKEEEADQTNAEEKNENVFNGPVPIKSIRKITSELISMSFTDKVEFCRNCVKLDELSVKQDLSLSRCKKLVDKRALTLLNECNDVLGTPKTTVMIKVDGNCLPRCGSFLAYGTEMHHRDIRLRIAIELIEYRHLYLSSEYLARGWTALSPKPSPAIYCMFSEHFTNQVLTEQTIEDLYHKEINDILSPNTYIGIWQMFAMASILINPLYSIYPNRGCPAVPKTYIG